MPVKTIKEKLEAIKEALFKLTDGKVYIKKQGIPAIVLEMLEYSPSELQDVIEVDIDTVDYLPSKDIEYIYKTFVQNGLITDEPVLYIEPSLFIELLKSKEYERVLLFEREGGVYIDVKYLSDLKRYLPVNGDFIAGFKLANEINKILKVYPNVNRLKIEIKEMNVEYKPTGISPRYEISPHVRQLLFYGPFDNEIGWINEGEQKDDDNDSDE